MLSQIIRLVEEAQTSKAPIERLVDQVAGIFVPVVMGLAALTFLAWLFWGPAPAVTRALVSMVAVLIIACPCAMGLATPTAVMVGAGRGAELGILMRGGEPLERAYRLTTVVFDKTGTLTRGTPQVTDLHAWEGWSADQILALAAALEAKSEHPLAEAVTHAAAVKHLILPQVEDFQALPGLGVEARVEGQEVLLGNLAFMAQKQIPTETLTAPQQEHAREGKTAIFLAVAGKPVGLIAAADTLKPGAAQAVKALQEMGLKILLLSGDNRLTVEAVAKSVGITDVLAEVLPGDKARKVAELQEAGRSGGHGGRRHQRRPGPGRRRRGHRPGHRRRRGRGGRRPDPDPGRPGPHPCGHPPLPADDAHHPPEPLLGLLLQRRGPAGGRRRLLPPLGLDPEPGPGRRRHGHELGERGHQ